MTSPAPQLDKSPRVASPGVVTVRAVLLTPAGTLPQVTVSHAQSSQPARDIRISRFLIAAAAVILFSGCRTEATPEQAGESEPSTDEQVAWEVFSGAWFEIDYPPGFEVRPSLATSTGSGGFDSAFFHSPDGKVSFYVCSPQWSREASDFRPVKDTERLISSEQQSLADGTRTVFRIAAEDGSYERIYEETVQHEGSVSWGTGIHYLDADTLEDYSGLYERFKESLEQFSD